MYFFSSSLLVFLFILFSNSNAAWIPQNSGVAGDLNSVSAYDGNHVWACGENGTLTRTTNGGVTWEYVPSTPSGSLKNIFVVNANTILVTGSAGSSIVWKTTNGGTNWTSVFFQSGGEIYSIEINNLGQGIMIGKPVGGRWSIWKTGNSGTTWDSAGFYLPQAGSELGYPNSLFISSSRAWFGTNNNRIYYSSNSGSSWATQTTPFSQVKGIAFSPTGSLGFSAGSNGAYTFNFAGPWNAAGQLNPADYSSVVVTPNGGGYAVRISKGNQILYSPTTFILNSFLEYQAPVNINDMALSRNGNDLWAVGDGGKIYYFDSTVSVSQISSSIPGKYSLSQNYPNPFNPSSNIKFDIVKSGFVSLKVYNSIGQEVSELVNESLPPGTYETTFDGSGLNSGIYFYTIRAGDFIETKKMMLIK